MEEEMEEEMVAEVAVADRRLITILAYESRYRLRNMLYPQRHRSGRSRNTALVD